MNYELVKASIASLLAAERDNQLALATTAGATDDQLANTYNFNVFTDLFALPDASQLPCVNLYNIGGDFDSGQGYTDSKWHVYNLAVDCYSISTAEPDDRADALSAARLDYLWSQVFATLGAEVNWHKGLRDVVRKARFVKWDQKMVGGGTNEVAEQILATQAILELQFEEPTEIVTGETLETIVASLEIDEQFISPFVTASITS
ncbi:MAG: hypothetical protein ACIAQ0_13515 [Phycisphaerales bacterium JB058]